jgi:hypothetical protein
MIHYKTAPLKTSIWEGNIRSWKEENESNENQCKKDEEITDSK